MGAPIGTRTPANRSRALAAVVVAGAVIACGTSSKRGFLADGAPAEGGVADAVAPDATTSDSADAATSDAGSLDASASDGADSRSDANFEPGVTGNLLLIGTVVTPDTSFDGEVLVEQDKITCVAPGSACAAMAAASGAGVVDTQGIIAPGLIDTHNHILFDIFDGTDWLPSQTYSNHDQWTSEPRYQAMLDVKQCIADDSQGRPTWCPATYQGTGSLRCEMDKWGELKAMIAGTTSIVGLPGTSSACFGSLSRSIDVAQNDLGLDTVQTSAIFPPSTLSGDGVCANFLSGKTRAYLIHCGEGVDATALGEFSTLDTLTTVDGCLLAPATTITHGTAFTAREFATMAANGMSLTWSPASNAALYGTTTNIPAALTAGVLLALAPDWSMGGSQNILDEFRFADQWDNTMFGDKLAAQDLVKMTTSNAAKVVAYDDRIGHLAVGYLADIVVISGDRTKPFDAIVAARPKDVQLTMVGGVALYGDAALKGLGPVAPGCEALDICGVPKFICVAETSTNDKLYQTYAQIKTALDAAMSDVDAIGGSPYTFSPLASLVTCN